MQILFLCQFLINKIYFWEKKTKQNYSLSLSLFAYLIVYVFWSCELQCLMSVTAVYQ